MFLLFLIRYLSFNDIADNWARDREIFPKKFPPILCRCKKESKYTYIQQIKQNKNS